MDSVTRCGKLERPEGSGRPWEVEECGLPVDPTHPKVGAPPLCADHLADWIKEEM